MSAIGTKEDKGELLRGYEQDPLHKYAEAFQDVIRGAIEEAKINFYTETADFYRKSQTNDEMKKFFIEDCYDEADPKYRDNPDAVKSLIENMETLYDNDRQAVLESAPLSSFNPIIGMALPLHKNVLMNTVFDQVMPKDVARSPRFTLTLERRILVDTQGKEYDMFLQQDKIYPSIEASVPQQDIVINLPENESVDVISTMGLTQNSVTNLSTKCFVNGLIANSYCAAGDSYYDTTSKTVKTVDGTTVTAGVKPVIFSTVAQFVPFYGGNSGIGGATGAGSGVNRVMMVKYSITTKTDKTTTATVAGTLTGSMIDNKFTFLSSNALVTGVQLHAVVDVSSAAFKTVKTKWDAKTTEYEIPEAPHVTCTISPEEVKDIQALYDVNQITKLMSMMRLALLNWKDDAIHNDLDLSYENMDSTAKMAGTFDFVPPVNFLNTPIQWRNEMFMDQLDIMVSQMLQVLNDENMTIAIFGRPDLIRRIGPRTDYTYATPSSIGPVELDFKRTVVTSDKRVYNFISSQKMRNNNNLIVLLIPRNTMRITYKVIDYQLYISNEIRDTENYQLPGMTCFERWMFLQYQPVQGRMRIANPRGLRENIANSDPIGTNAMNDYTANAIDHASTVNGATLGDGNI